MMPRWLTWLFIVVLGYLVFSVGEQHREAPSPVALPSAAQEAAAAQAIADFTDIESWKRTLNPDYAATHDCSMPNIGAQALSLKRIDDLPGEGPPAICGEAIAIRLTVWNASGKSSYQGRLTLALGSRTLAQGLDAGLLGIKPHGVRTLVLPPAALVRNPKSKGNGEAVAALGRHTLAVVTVERLE